MITNELIQFFGGPIIAAVATVNAAGRPFFTRAYGVRGQPGSVLLDVYIPEHMAERPLADLKENNRLATVVADVANFFTRQFKGTLRTIAPADADEIALVNATLEKSGAVIGNFFGSGAGAGWLRHITDPALHLTMEIVEMYDQTPGPGAGQRLN